MWGDGGDDQIAQKKENSMYQYDAMGLEAKANHDDNYDWPLIFTVLCI